MRNRAVCNQFLPDHLCKELIFIHRSLGVAGYRPHVRSTTLFDVLLAEPSVLPALVRARQLVWEAAEQQFDCLCELFVEHTGLISWLRGASIGWHHDSNRPYLSQRHYSAVVYLNSADEGFTGGAFCFQSGPPPLRIKPAAGQLLLYSADDSNIHCVEPVTDGERFTLTMWFTRSKAAQEDTKVLSLLAGGMMGSGLPATLYLQHSQHQTQQDSQANSTEHRGQPQQSHCHQQQDLVGDEPWPQQPQHLDEADVRRSMLQQLGVELIAGNMGHKDLQQDMQMQMQHQVDSLRQAAGPATAGIKYILKPVTHTVTCEQQGNTACGSAAGQIEAYQQQRQHGTAQQQQQLGHEFSSVQAAVMAISMLQWQLCCHEQQNMLSRAPLHCLRSYPFDERYSAATAGVAEDDVLGNCCCGDRRCASASCSSCTKLHAEADQLVAEYLSAGARDLHQLVPRWSAAGALIM